MASYCRRTTTITIPYHINQPRNKNKLQAFGYNVTKLNGHDNRSLEALCYLNDRLNAVILDTIKGLGVPFLERNPTNHVLYMHEKPEVMKEALENLKDD